MLAGFGAATKPPLSIIFSEQRHLLSLPNFTFFPSPVMIYFRTGPGGGSVTLCPANFKPNLRTGFFMNRPLYRLDPRGHFPWKGTGDHDRSTSPFLDPLLWTSLASRGCQSAAPFFFLRVALSAF